MLSPGPELLLSTEGSYRAGYGDMSVILALEGAGRRVKIAKSACVTPCQPRLQGTISEKEKKEGTSQVVCEAMFLEFSPVLVFQFCNELSLLLVGIEVKAGVSGRTGLWWREVICFFSPKFKYPESETDC